MFRPLLKRSPWLPVPALVFRGLCSGSFKEIRIPVPWGHIAAKEWGHPPAAGRPVLGLHGWQDNCCTFDPLMPHLLQSGRGVHLLAIDLPGHGQSSALPAGMPYTIFVWLDTVRRVVVQQGWSSFSILAHSLGAGIGLVYASCFPQEVRQLLSLDGSSTTIYPNEDVAGHVRRGLEDLAASAKGQQRPPKSDGETTKAMVKMTRGSLTEVTARVLLGRQEGCYGDPRLLVIPIASFNEGQFEQMAGNLTCDILSVTFNEGISTFRPEATAFFRKLLGKTTASSETVKVDGMHHVHMSSPERIAPHVGGFLFPS